MVSDLYASLAEPPFQLIKAAIANTTKVSASMVSDLYASLAEPPFQLSKAATANMPKVSASIVSDLDAPEVVPTAVLKALQVALAMQQSVFLFAPPAAVAVPADAGALPVAQLSELA